ncbi:MAG: hypothetical protein PWP40_107 [Rhodocyclaceae bacterium]|nr:hypothetical protein [Rhodocyclaceae bacterium]
MTYTHPPRAALGRIHPLADVPAAIKGASLERTAHHEAGHVVLMEWAGLTPTKASASAGNGLAEWDLAEIGADDPPTDHDRPLAAAQAAAVMHAGICAELIYVGHRWQGVTVRMRSKDWQLACMLLAQHFGPGLAGHGFSQRTALAVLTQHWPRVQQIAAHLIEHGTWRPENEQS